MNPIKADILEQLDSDNFTQIYCDQHTFEDGLREAQHIIDRVSPSYCNWKYDETHDKWDTECREGYYFASKGPKENDFGFCPYCGRMIKTKERD